ncbi:hypothetical protein IEQ34_001435 [Dendrobium chrysotoxum]|uniref:LysM domain-containing protein n=1 Tax=Dendrobium chrysotoxum TaxID=161865 RepID=A0AAV7HQF2_DENCH|nr:hypothetical protein IEQ34_001435 [Dendrobium chrysotoxum]
MKKQLNQTVLALLLLLSILVGMEGRSLLGRERRCDEIYVVKQGETLQTISVDCNTLSILDDNPQIVDTDDIGPGTVLYIRPSSTLS